MSEIKFSKEEVDLLVSKVKNYFSSELDHEIGAFEAEFLKAITPHFSYT